MEQNPHSKLGDFVRLERKRLDISQAELADAAGIGHSMISMIEAGKARPSAATCDALAMALQVNPNTLRELAGHPRIDDAVIRSVAEFEPYSRMAKAELRPLVVKAIRKLLRLSEHDLSIVVRQMEAFPDEAHVPASASDSDDDTDDPARKRPRRHRNN
jgi:transcriptional regulator with XRE-family HTH domain